MATYALPSSHKDLMEAPLKTLDPDIAAIMVQTSLCLCAQVSDRYTEK